MTEPTLNFRMALRNVELDAYQAYIQYCYPSATMVRRKLDVGYELRNDETLYLSLNGKRYESNFNIAGFQEIVTSVQNNNRDYWYEKVLREAEVCLLKQLNLPNRAALKTLCACCEGLIDYLVQDENCFEFSQDSHYQLTPFELKVRSVMYELFEAPFPLPGKEWVWLNGGTDQL